MDEIFIICKKVQDNEILLGFITNKEKAIKYCYEKNQVFGTVNNMDYCHVYYYRKFKNLEVRNG